MGLLISLVIVVAIVFMVVRGFRRSTVSAAGSEVAPSRKTAAKSARHRTQESFEADLTGDELKEAVAAAWRAHKEGARPKELKRVVEAAVRQKQVQLEVEALAGLEAAAQAVAAPGNAVPARFPARAASHVPAQKAGAKHRTQAPRQTVQPTASSLHAPLEAYPALPTRAPLPARAPLGARRALAARAPHESLAPRAR